MGKQLAGELGMSSEPTSCEMAVRTGTSLPTPTALCHVASLPSLNALHEANPMMGLRGCRLGIVHPEITKMQVRLRSNGNSCSSSISKTSTSGSISFAM